MEEKFLLIIILSLANFYPISSRCGQPDLPYMSTNNEAKPYYEENDTIKIECVEGVVVSDTYVRDNNGTIKCINNNWEYNNWRCSQLLNFTSIEIVHDEHNDSYIHNEVMNSNNFDLLKCVPIKEKWLIKLKKPKIITHIAIVAGSLIKSNAGSLVKNNTESLVKNKFDKLDNHPIDFQVTLGGQNCTTENDSNTDMINTVLIYKCHYHLRVESITIELTQKDAQVNVCGLDIFGINDETCGQVEIPLYTDVVIENKGNNKIANYSCKNDYALYGAPIRRCSSLGLWYPKKAPKCLPRFKCNLLSNSNFSYQYHNLDMYGFALPHVSKVFYECSNESFEISKIVERTCLTNGQWSPLRTLPFCHPKNHIVKMLGHLKNNKNMIYYGVGAIGLLFLVSLIILLHMRRLAKRISRQMRENSYKEQGKKCPNDPRYTDIIVWSNELKDSDKASQNNKTTYYSSVQYDDEKY